MSEASPTSPSAFALPRPIAAPRPRAPKPNIPPTALERNRLLQFVRNYVAEHNPVPPLPLDHLAEYASRVIELLPSLPAYRDYIGVLINNEVWREGLAAVPFSRRLLLLPKCLRSVDQCRASFDEFGLVCKQCGQCSIHDLQTQAEQLGYAVLVAEGSALVTSLIQTGKIEAIVGVSCLNVLERAFPFMESAAIPGIAIPLLQDDCADTSVDLDWVWDYIHLTSADATRRMDLTALRETVDAWFTPLGLENVMGSPEGETEQIARQWLCRAGKRWRPFLTVAAFQALHDHPLDTLPQGIGSLAVAIECFHKASLIHDDIEDHDATRYGEKTLHEQYGIPVALNVGDLLIGEGYRLIAECEADASVRVEMLRVAARGQQQLCRGQGAELCWARNPSPLPPQEVIDIFRRKTAPAFDVALKLGALFAAASGQVFDAKAAAVLDAYSEALGIAYQIRDDLNDLGGHGDPDDISGLRPSLLLAVAYERAVAPEHKKELESLWRRTPQAEMTPAKIESLYEELGAINHVMGLLGTYQAQAVRALRDLENPNLKGLLRRVIGKIFNPAEIKGWCKEFEPGKD